MRGFKGVSKGIEKGLTVFHQFDLYPAANLGIKRNWAGTENNLFHRGMASDDRERADEYQKDIRHDVRTFLSFVRQLGFILVNFCYRTEGATVSLPRRPGLFFYQRR